MFVEVWDYTVYNVMTVLYQQFWGFYEENFHEILWYVFVKIYVESNIFNVF